MRQITENVIYLATECQTYGTIYTEKSLCVFPVNGRHIITTRKRSIPVNKAEKPGVMMGTNESSKEQAILDQYKMGELEAKSVKAWAKVYDTDEIMGSYLEKQGYPFSVHLENKERKILDQYKMGVQEARSVKAWTKVYETDDFMDAYLEKSGYPKSKPDTEKSAA